MVTVPTIRDRVAQAAAKVVLEPIFEADFTPNAYGCRPKKNARQAIEQVHGLLRSGDPDVVDADLSKFYKNFLFFEELVDLLKGGYELVARLLRKARGR